MGAFSYILFSHRLILEPHMGQLPAQYCPPYVPDDQQKYTFAWTSMFQTPSKIVKEKYVELLIPSTSYLDQSRRLDKVDRNCFRMASSKMNLENSYCVNGRRTITGICWKERSLLHPLVESVIIMYQMIPRPSK